MAHSDEISNEEFTWGMHGLMDVHKTSMRAQ